MVAKQPSDTCQNCQINVTQPSDSCQKCQNCQQPSDICQSMSELSNICHATIKTAVNQCQNCLNCQTTIRQLWHLSDYFWQLFTKNKATPSAFLSSHFWQLSENSFAPYLQPIPLPFLEGQNTYISPPFRARLVSTGLRSTPLYYTPLSSTTYPPARDWRSTAVQKVASHYYSLTQVVSYPCFFLHCHYLSCFFLLYFVLSTPSMRDFSLPMLL